MTITLHTSRGDLAGDSIPAIIAAEWGPDAVLALLGDSPKLGQVIERDQSQPRAWRVVDTVTSASTPDGDVHYSGGEWMDAWSADPLAGVRAATGDLAVARGAVDEREQHWQAAIRDALAAGQRVVDVAEAAGVSRERVYQIRDGRR